MSIDSQNGSNGKLAIFFKIVDRYGFPIFVVLMLMGGMYKGTVWIADKILAPIAAGHLKIVDKQSDLLDDISEEIKKDREDGQKREELLKKLYIEQEKTTSEQTRTAVLIERLLNNLDTKLNKLPSNM